MSPLSWREGLTVPKVIDSDEVSEILNEESATSSKSDR